MSYKNKNVKVKSNDVNKPKESFWKKFFKKEIEFFSRLGEKSRNLVSKEPNFIIFLIMTFTLSVMYEETGLSRTLPIVLIVSFLIGTFYGRRKATMLHTVIASVILGTVSGDAELTATIIIVSLVCTFSGLYLSKYLDNRKKSNFFIRTFKLVFAVFMCIVSFIIYSYYFGVPTDYMKARKVIEAEAKTVIEGDELNINKAVYQGIKYNASGKTYDALYTCVDENLMRHGVYLMSYNPRTGELVKNIENVEEPTIEETNENIE